jgi:hypothetical protein
LLNPSGVIGARRRLLNFGVPEEFIEMRSLEALHA